MTSAEFLIVKDFTAPSNAALECRRNFLPLADGTSASARRLLATRRDDHRFVLRLVNNGHRLPQARPQMHSHRAVRRVLRDFEEATTGALNLCSTPRQWILMCSCRSKFCCRRRDTRTQSVWYNEGPSLTVHAHHAGLNNEITNVVDLHADSFFKILQPMTLPKLLRVLKHGVALFYMPFFKIL